MRDLCFGFVQLSLLLCSKHCDIINLSLHCCDTDHEPVEADGAVDRQRKSGLAGVDGPLLPGVDVASQRQQGNWVGAWKGGRIHVEEVLVLLKLREIKGLQKWVGIDWKFIAMMPCLKILDNQFYSRPRGRWNIPQGWHSAWVGSWEPWRLELKGQSHLKAQRLALLHGSAAICTNSYN